ncbi:Hydrogenase isoenzymes formation protein HypC [Clostridium liquoris]|jgi:hydrogenase expression/formation protein HypC|uniref:Hydrogenase isoenzymes formation protein HypC n=1 Tax=Clostridium liquoris TaxID=1289519 RepID=A0A2T0B4A6_9CLOT|nr:HypC/HybG/HupF family hydrogenase formation chaperone [Clostridium liquoris]PRR78719.1 Hydrogenase isoenzymes formation protein HypC [Clostridium liquoris]
MCVGIPLKVLEIQDKEAIGEISGVKRKIRIDFLPNLNIGDYVMTHAGFALDLIKQEDANEIIEAIKLVNSKI